jgi:ligand-binding SRPBCC domain-containing protein
MSESPSTFPKKIYAGLLIGYRMKVVFGIPALLSEVRQCDEPKRFVCQQRIGPFKCWSHEVCLTETQNGIALEDIIFYVLPFGWVGELLNRWLSAGGLKRIFDTRRDYLQAKWRLSQPAPGSDV